MEANKENIRWTKQTRIPVPFGNLPALPNHLLQKKVQGNSTGDEVRLPLRTLNTSPLAGPSNTNYNNEKHQQTKKRPIKIDNKNVTLRQKNETLDWDYKVFKDDQKEDSIILISDDESFDKNDEKTSNFFTEQGENNIGDVLKASTPVPSALEASRIRNVKRSLKRPHSRELQGLSPVILPHVPEQKKFKRCLDFNDCSVNPALTRGYSKKSYESCIEKDYSTDIFLHLMSTERNAMLPLIPSETRACVLNWLMRVDGPGSPEVIQTAIWYFDSVLHVSTVTVEKLQVVAAGCYWISMKIHGPVASASKLVKCSKNAFTTGQLRDVEAAILKILRFPPQPVIPQDYIKYLSWVLDKTDGSEVMSAATFLCMTGMMVDKTLCTKLPSVIAAACVKNAILLLRKRDLQKKLQTTPVYQAAEKKTKNMCAVCSALRRAVRILGSPSYVYKAPMEHYGQAPGFVAQKIVSYANELA